MKEIPMCCPLCGVKLEECFTRGPVGLQLFWHPFLQGRSCKLEARHGDMIMYDRYEKAHKQLAEKDREIMVNDKTIDLIINVMLEHGMLSWEPQEYKEYWKKQAREALK